MKGKWLFKMLGMFVIGTFVIGLAVMVLWNALVPDLFRGPILTYWQAIGLLVLSHILLRGWGRGARGGWHRDRWRKRWEEKLAAMSPEERENFKQEWGQRCGWSSKEFDSKTSS